MCHTTRLSGLTEQLSKLFLQGAVNEDVLVDGLHHAHALLAQQVHQLRDGQRLQGFRSAAAC